MTSRQAGRRIVCISAQRRRKGTKRNGARQSVRPRENHMQPKERRQLVQRVICSGVFVLLVAAKLRLPERMVQVNAKISAAMERNMDVQAVFSAVGRAFAGEENVDKAADVVYQAVFHPDKKTEAVETIAQISGVQATSALDTLQGYRRQQEPERSIGEQLTAEEISSSEQVSTLAYVLYSNQNLPEDVSMEQAILDFDYCTPVSGTISSEFGYRDHPVEGEERFHNGVDLAANKGTEIDCFADGVVKAVGESSSYGKYCIITHEGGYSTLYAHCDRITTSSGAEVAQGEKIAEVGETGIATGPHLHFELHKDGVYLNPIYYVSSL